MNELDKLLRNIEALLQQETDPAKRRRFRMIIEETIRKFELMKSA